MSKFEIVIVGAVLGWVIGQLLLIFFMNEIFEFIDRLVSRVRRACGLRDR